MPVFRPKRTSPDHQESLLAPSLFILNPEFSPCAHWGHPGSLSPLPHSHQGSLKPRRCEPGVTCITSRWSEVDLRFLSVAGAALTKCHTCTQGLQRQDIYFSKFWTLEGRIKVLAGEVSGEGPPRNGRGPSGWGLPWPLCVWDHLSLSLRRRTLCLSNNPMGSGLHPSDLI